MSQGSVPRQADLFRDTTEFRAPLARADSIHALLARECHALFPDELFSDLFADVGRRSVPPLVVAVVMVLQRLEGLSDREAVERFTFDARWKYAAGGLPFDYPGFAHTVLVDMRARLARSDRVERIFERTLEVARAASLVGVRRVLDSTPLYDAVATMDTVPWCGARSGACSGHRRPGARPARESSGATTTTARGGKPGADWDDAAARAALVDALARDGEAVLEVLERERLSGLLAEAATLLATVLGQDLEEGGDGRLRIARRVVHDRVISTVDPDTRHGHKTEARGFDGYEGHVALDPDAELVTATADAAYGTGAVLATLEAAGVVSRVKVQPPNAPDGRFTKADLTVDLVTRTVTCPAGWTVSLIRHAPGFEARFRSACATCPLAPPCTTAAGGRRVKIGPHEAHLAQGRTASRDPAWLADYRATRPKVERKLAHLVRRRHGGRRARVRGTLKVGADFSLLAAAVNLARLAVLGLTGSGGTWAAARTG